MTDQLSLMPLQVNPTAKTNVKALAAKANFSTSDKLSSARKTAQEFETSFLTTMLEQMWTGIEAEAPFGGGHAEKVYRSMIVGEYAKSIAASGGIGMADHVYREILSAQEGRK